MIPSWMKRNDDDTNKFAVLSPSSHDEDKNEDENDHDCQNRSVTTGNVRILMEIVSATGLSMVSSSSSSSKAMSLSSSSRPIDNTTTRTTTTTTNIDPYCIVWMKKNHHNHPNNTNMIKIHRTKTIRNDTNPIWNVLTKSLCLLTIPKLQTPKQKYNKEAEADSSNSIEETWLTMKSPSKTEYLKKKTHDSSNRNNKYNNDDDSSTHEDKGNEYTNDNIFIEVCHGPNRQHIIGTVTIPVGEIYKHATKDNGLGGERLEFPIVMSSTHSNKIQEQEKKKEKEKEKKREKENEKKKEKEKEISNQDEKEEPCHQQGKRDQTTKIQEDNNDNCRGTLALRFREASPDDLSFMEQAALMNNDATTNSQESVNKKSFFSKFRSTMSPLPCYKTDVALDINFKQVTYRRTKAKKNVLVESSDVQKKKQKKKQRRKKLAMVSNNEDILYRIQPYPDPTREESTSWMTEKRIDEEALQPSTKWIRAGQHNNANSSSPSSSLGTIFLEVVRCDNLPNLDFGIGEKTDPFIMALFEDSVLRTNIIFDTLSPRWMPWSTRAFMFDIVHPSSLLMLGVFDYDNAPFDDHDSVGRVVIDTANFESHTTYLLHYALHDHPQKMDDRGKIVLRLRIEWKNESLAMKMRLKPPPRFLINTENEKAFKCVKYLCHGKVDMEKATLSSIQLHIDELVTYKKHIFLLIDYLCQILLWRGQTTVTLPWRMPLRWSSSSSRTTTVVLWFPIHSIMLFVATILSVEYPSLIPVILCYSIAWIMISINYHQSMYPQPWLRSKSFYQQIKVMILGRSLHGPIHIDPYDGIEQAQILEKLNTVRAQRVERFVTDLAAVISKASQIHTSSNISSISLASKDSTGVGSFPLLHKLLGSNLIVIHSLLHNVCTQLRLLRNIVLWKSSASSTVTIYCLVGGTAYLLLPLHSILLWSLRIWVWVLLGPWMKLVDIFWVHPHYRTVDELVANDDFQLFQNNTQSTHNTAKQHLLDLEESLLQSSKVQEWGRYARMVKEESNKLDAMRKHCFGTKCAVIPTLDTSRFPSVPLSESTAMPYDDDHHHQHEKNDQQQHSHYQASTSLTFINAPGQRLEGHMIHKRVV